MDEVVVLGAALPQVGVSGTDAAGSGIDLTKGRVGNALRAGSSTTGLDPLSRIVGFEGSWQLDVFGKYRRLIEAARDDAETLAEMRRAVLITVIADVVRTYVEIRGLQSRLEAARTDVATEQKTVDLVQDRYARGLTSEVDVTLRQTAIGEVAGQAPGTDRRDLRRPKSDGGAARHLFGWSQKWNGPASCPACQTACDLGYPSSCCGGDRTSDKPNASSPRRLRELVRRSPISSGGGGHRRLRNSRRAAIARWRGAHQRSDLVDRAERLLAVPRLRRLGRAHLRPGVSHPRAPAEIQEDHPGCGGGSEYRDQRISGRAPAVTGSANGTCGKSPFGRARHRTL